jgi:hypothetical protein
MVDLQKTLWVFYRRSNNYPQRDCPYCLPQVSSRRARTDLLSGPSRHGNRHQPPSIVSVPRNTTVCWKNKRIAALIMGIIWSRARVVVEKILSKSSSNGWTIANLRAVVAPSRLVPLELACLSTEEARDSSLWWRTRDGYSDP